jgi:hypothetical protein
MNEIYISAGSGLNITCQLYVAAATVGATFNATEIGTTGDYFTYIPAWHTLWLLSFNRF